MGGPSLLLCAAALLLLPTLLLFAEVLAALIGRRRVRAPPCERPRIAVIVPAHNETSGVIPTLQAVRRELITTDRLIVIADNCTDDTADVARASGAEVIERHDDAHRGKGYALDFGVRHLVTDPPDVVIVVDADCLVASGAIDALSRACMLTQRPVQALYLMHPPPGAGPMMRIAAFAWCVKNLVRPQGLHHLGQPCHLMGTGMAFTWRQISSATLATGHIVEDLKLGIDFARRGTPPVFLADAVVSSTFPASSDGARSQRMRWEHGYLGIMFTEAPGALLDAIRRRDLALAVLALDLGIPPLALLTLLVGTTWMLSALATLFGSYPAFIVSTVTLATLFVTVLLAWAGWGRRTASLGDLFLAVGYAVRKIPLYGRFIVGRQLRWVRSRRDTEHPNRTDSR